jgi:hypothetical protein|tara:strand:+ start:162 stop:899 length:738 start_codon:yes stop_codon:yes gene_type:complete
MTYYLTTSAGWGNISLTLSDYVYKTDKPRVHKKLLDVVKCIDFHGLEFTDNEDEEAYEKQITINPFTRSIIHSKIRDIVKPNERLQKLIEKHDHGLTHGIHIRRGAYSKDAESIGHHGLDENGNINKPYFVSDSGLEKFEDIIKQSDKKFFLASDSKELKNILKTKYPDKIVTLDHDISFTYEDDILKNYGIPEETIYACYLDWFLLSKCKNLYVSAGNEDMCSLSTFGYSAGAYGNSDVYIILN